VIVDAAFLNRGDQHDIAALAQRLGVRFVGLWLSVDPETMARRVAGRTGDASDADAGVLARQLAAHPDAPGWTRIAGGGAPAAVAAAAREALAAP
jgi:predicted kinase